MRYVPLLGWLAVMTCYALGKIVPFNDYYRFVFIVGMGLSGALVIHFAEEQSEA